MAAMLRFLLLSVALFLAGCAGTSYQQDPPKIILDGVHSAAGQTGAPRFRIDLRVQNPNAEPLDIAGISYEVLVQDVELLSGVTSDVPVIQGYSEELVTVEPEENTLSLVYRDKESLKFVKYVNCRLGEAGECFHDLFLTYYE